MFSYITCCENEWFESFIVTEMRISRNKYITEVVENFGENYSFLLTRGTPQRRETIYLNPVMKLKVFYRRKFSYFVKYAGKGGHKNLFEIYEEPSKSFFRFSIPYHTKKYEGDLYEMLM